MKLLTKEIQSKLPTIGSQPDAEDPMVWVKFFTPDAGWTWYATEGEPDGNDFLFYGFVVGPFPEWGSFALSDLESVRGKLGLPVERDLYFQPVHFKEIAAGRVCTLDGFAPKPYASFTINLQRL